MQTIKSIFSSIIILALLAAPLFAVAQTGITNNLYVNADLDIAGRQKVSSTLRHTSQNAYFYVEDNYYNNLSSSQKDSVQANLQSLAAEFDNNIYPTLTNTYGTEPNPGIDNDPRVTILITQMVNGTGGYFLPRNQQPRSVEPNSNEREMLYLNSNVVVNEGETNSNFAKHHIAHEFVHLIQYNQKTNAHGTSHPRWLNEALADYAPTLLGYNNDYEDSYLQKRANDFTSFPSASLEFWRDKDTDMANASLFAHYLVSQYGQDVLKEITGNSRQGRASINAALSDLGHTESFEDVFANWAVANYANGTPGQNYSYNQPLSFSRLHVPASVNYSMFTNSSVQTSLAVQHTAALWVKFTPGQLGQNSANTLNIQFDASDSQGVFKVPYIKTDITGRTTVGELELKNAQGEINFYDFGTNILSVVLVPSNYQTQDNSGASGFFNLKAKLTDKINPDEDDEGEVLGESIFADGALVRETGDNDVYIIKLVGEKKFKRLILNPDIFNSYGHLKWQNIIEASEGALDTYITSNLIRQDTGSKVYKVTSAPNTDTGQKTHLNMTPATFESCSHDWDSIYIVNAHEIADTFYPETQSTTSC